MLQFARRQLRRRRAGAVRRRCSPAAAGRGRWPTGRRDAGARARRLDLGATTAPCHLRPAGRAVPALLAERRSSVLGRRVAARGEALDAGGCGQRRRATVLNAYGPTEATVDCTDRAASSPAAPAARRVPIGRPLANTRCLRPGRARCGPVPAGRAGELYIGGRRPGPRLPRPAGADRRAVRRRPVRPRPARGMYRTGDLVRWRRRRRAGVPRPRRRPGQDARLPDRARRDRGRARATTRTSRRPPRSSARTGPADQRLVGLRRARPRRGADGRRRHCARTCAAASARATWCPPRSSSLDALPLTPNGKLDRRGAARARHHGPPAAAARPAHPREEAAVRAVRRGAGRRRRSASTTTSSTSAATRCWPPGWSARLRDGPAASSWRCATCSRPRPSAGARPSGWTPTRPAAATRSTSCCRCAPRAARPPLFCVHPGGGLGWSYAGLLRHLGPTSRCTACRRAA